MPAEKKVFYTVIRKFLQNGTETHSVQDFEDQTQAVKRYFNILGADVGEDDKPYVACYVITSEGLMIEGRVFDERPAPEPEPEPEA